jgi:PIN domain nuclease of toxin-antitoxin system
LDTHIALWIDSGDERLRSSTRVLIDECWHRGGSVLISAVSVWEIAQLVGAGRIELNRSVAAWLADFCDVPGVRAIPLSPVAAARSYELRHLEHRDPADRLLIATAIELGCALITYDGRIVAFAERHGRRYGFSVES